MNFDEGAITGVCHRSEASCETYSKRVNEANHLSEPNYSLIPKLFENLNNAGEKMSRAAGINKSQASAKSTFTATNLQDIEQQFSRLNLRGAKRATTAKATATALKTSVVRFPKDINQLLVRKKIETSKRAVLSQRELI